MALGDALAAVDDTRASARPAYEQVLTRAPHDLGARLGLGQLDLAAGRASQAAAHFLAVLAAEPQQDAARRGYAACLQELDMPLTRAVLQD